MRYRPRIRNWPFNVSRGIKLVDTGISVNSNGITVNPSDLIRGFIRNCVQDNHMLGYHRDGVADEVLDTLSHSIRRRLLFSLYEQGQDTSELPLQQVSGLAFEEENISTELYHAHLPKLEDNGYVLYDDDNHTITKGPEWNQIEPLLRLVYNHLNELPSQLRGTRSMA